MRKKIPTFSPTNISGCQVWFDAADASTIIAPTGTVTAWVSKGAATMTATASGTASPTYTKYNGFPGIAFNGTTTKMLTGTISSFATTGTTWIAVSVNFSPVSATLPPDASVVMASQGAGPERGIRYDSTTSATSYSINSGTLRQDTGNNTNGIRGFIDTAAAFNAYTNGTNTASNTTAVTFQAGSNQGLVMGQWNVGWLNGFIFELLIYNRDLTITEYQQVEAYLAQKWGYTGALPAGHPGTLGVIVPQVSKSFARPTLYYKNYQLTQIPGCLLWLDAADSVATGFGSVATGTAITTWKDKSGTGNHFTVTSGTATVIQDGIYTVIGIPTGTLLTSTNTIATTSTTTVFAVFKATSTNYMMFLAFSGLLSGDLSIRCSSYVVPPGGTTNANDLFNGVTMYVDGNTVTTATMSSYHIVSGTMSTSGTTTVTISSTAWSSGRMFIGNAAEIVMYSGPLTTAQRQTVESYLADKWGLVQALPTGHAHTATPAGLPTSVPSAIHLIYALSKFMSTVYALSTYSLVNIANAVIANTATPAYIWTAAVPSNAKGKNGILAVVFNLFSATQFSANQTFDYGVYVDGVSQLMGDSATMHYVQTASGNYAIAYGGVSLGINGILGGQPLFFPLVLGPSASQIQIGLKNSQSYMSPVNSSVPGYSSNILTSSGSSNTSNYIPQTAFTTPGYSTYTVPSVCSAGAVTGVYIYLWGASGYSETGGTNNAGGPGGFVSGFYSCSPGTVLSVVIGTCTGTGQPPSLGGQGSGWHGSGGFTGVFLGSSTASVVQSNAIGIAGGGGGSSYQTGAGGYGGYPAGGNSVNSSPVIYGGTQTAGGTGTGGSGSALQGGDGCGGWGSEAGAGGWYGGGGGSCTGSGAYPGGGGSSYIGNVNGATGGIGFTSSAAYANGASQTSPGSDAPAPANNNSYYISGYALGRANTSSSRYSTGLAVIVPAVGTAATQVGVSATLFSA